MSAKGPERHVAPPRRRVIEAVSVPARPRRANVADLTFVCAKCGTPRTLERVFFCVARWLQRTGGSADLMDANPGETLNDGGEGVMARDGRSTRAALARQSTMPICVVQTRPSVTTYANRRLHGLWCERGRQTRLDERRARGHLGASSEQGRRREGGDKRAVEERIWRARRTPGANDV